MGVPEGEQPARDPSRGKEAPGVELGCGVPDQRIPRCGAWVHAGRAGPGLKSAKLRARQERLVSPERRAEEDRGEQGEQDHRKGRREA